MGLVRADETVEPQDLCTPKRIKALEKQQKGKPQRRREGIEREKDKKDSVIPLKADKPRRGAVAI